PLAYHIKGRSIAINRLRASPKTDSRMVSKELQQMVSGRVTDEKGTSLSGVSVAVKGTDRGTSTATDGTYTIEVPAGQQVLVVNYMGYAPQEIVWTGQAEVNVMLKE